MYICIYVCVYIHANLYVCAQISGSMRFLLKGPLPSPSCCQLVPGVLRASDLRRLRHGVFLHPSAISETSIDSHLRLRAELQVGFGPQKATFQTSLSMKLTTIIVIIIYIDVVIVVKIVKITTYELRPATSSSKPHSSPQCPWPKSKGLHTTLF